MPFVWLPARERVEFLNLSSRPVVRCPPADSFLRNNVQALTVYRQVLAEDPDHDEARRGVAEAEKGQRLATMSEEEMMAAVQKMPPPLQPRARFERISSGGTPWLLP